MRLDRRLVSGAVLTLIGLAFFFSQYASWSSQFQACPNKDTLLWDANMRLLQALDGVDDLRQGIILPVLRDLLASPTWPPLRTLFSMGILIAHGHPDPVADMWPSEFFLLALVPLLAFFAAFFSPRSVVPSMGGRAYFALLFLTALFLLAGLEDLPQYVFSSMLEVQGMFFFTWNAWAIYLVYRHYETSQGPVSRALKASFFLSGLGLYMTKYPYGILTGVSLLALELIRHPAMLGSALLQSLRARYRGWRLAPFALLALAACLILIGPHIAHDLVNTRLAKNFIYVALLWIFVDFNLYLWRYRPASFPASTRLFYLWFVLPFATVLLSHPDRFGSLIQAQTDRVTARRTYLLTLFDDYFVQNRVFAALVLGGLLLTVAAYVVQRLRTFPVMTDRGDDISPAVHGQETGAGGASPEGRAGWRWHRWVDLFQRMPLSLKIRPEITMVIFLWFNVFVMEFLTSNHQARYVFQILPLMVFFHGSLLPLAAEMMPVQPSLRTVGAVLVMLILSGFCVLPFLSDMRLFLSGRPGMGAGLTSGQMQRHVCFSGTDPAPFDAARRIAAWTPESSNAILINEFHDAHSTPTGRAQATEVDLFLRYRVWGHGQMRTDSKYRFNDWLRFSEALHVTTDCGAPGEELSLMKRAAQVHATLVRTDQYTDASGLCAVRYRIVRR